MTDVTGDGFSLARARTNDQEIERVSPNEQLLGRQPSGAAGQHEVAQDRRSANRQRAGDAYLRHVLIGGRNDADQIEGLRSLAELQRQHYARR